MKYRKSVAACVACGTLAGMILSASCSSSSSPAANSATGGSAGLGVGGSTSAGCTPMPGTPLSCDLNGGGTDPADPALTDFTEADAGTATWSNTTGKWGVAGNLLGSVFAYRGPNTTTTDWPAQTVANGVLSDGGNVAASDYAGIGMSFDQCVNTATYTGIEFTLTGNKAGCTLQFQLQTLDEQETNNKGLCDSCTSTCFLFPKTTLSAKLDPTTPTPITVMFSDLASTGMPAAAADFAKEIIGLQWHLQAGTTACTGVQIAIDDVSFITGTGSSSSSTGAASSSSSTGAASSSSSTGAGGSSSSAGAGGTSSSAGAGGTSSSAGAGGTSGSGGAGGK